EQLRHVADLLLDGVAVRRNIQTDYLSSSARRTNEAREHLDRGGLPCTVRPEETEDFAATDGERHRIDCRKRPVASREAVHFNGHGGFVSCHCRWWTDL